MELNVNVSGGEQLAAVVKNVLEPLLVPGARQAGLIIEDLLRGWRLVNLDRVVRKLRERNLIQDGRYVHPQLLDQLIQGSSWTDDDDLQEMWAGLIGSSCCDDGRDLSNLTFARLLRELTPSQARLIRLVVERVTWKRKSPKGQISAQSVNIPVDEFLNLLGQTCAQTCQMDVVSLVGLGLLGTKNPWSHEGIHSEFKDATLHATLLAFGLYVRCNGSRQTVRDYFGLDTDAEFVDSLENRKGI